MNDYDKGYHDAMKDMIGLLSDIAYSERILRLKPKGDVTSIHKTFTLIFNKWKKNRGYTRNYESFKKTD